MKQAFANMVKFRKYKGEHMAARPIASILIMEEALAASSTIPSPSKEEEVQSFVVEKRTVFHY